VFCVGHGADKSTDLDADQGADIHGV
jgi:hypothetical protein